MSRTTTLQLIAAVITIAVLYALRQGADWFLSGLEPRFMMGMVLGFMAGAVMILLIWYYEDSKERRSRAASRGSTAHEQSTRHSIDL